MDRWLEKFATTNLRRSADTAHDLKTPLNVAVLNLELLRMRVAKVSGSQVDEKLAGYTVAIETELRRMAQIFDTFFVLSTPPKEEGEPVPIELGPLCREIATESGVDLVMDPLTLTVPGHQSRIRQCLRQFFDGVSRLFSGQTTVFEARDGDGSFELRATSESVPENFEPTKIFKFYYTDLAGNADLSLASARLIAETYGGELNASQDRDKVTLRLQFPTR
ncbi:MAG: histidine kinase dimerization/phospho-acceptor domain-containing protein [Thermoanaerobaculia bacterium]